MSKPQVSIVMGSDSDLEIMREAGKALDEFGIQAEISPISSADWAQKRPTSAIRPGYSVLDLSPLQRQIGRPMRPWREGLKDFRLAVQRDGF